jgi:S1-C subfamily serine protease
LAPAGLMLWRAGKSRDATATLTAPPDTPAREVAEIEGATPMAGATVGNLNPAFNEELNLKSDQTGVVVTAVKPGSPAARLGIQPYDLVVSVNHHKIETVTQLRQALGAGAPPWTIVIHRKDKTFTAVLK